MERVVLQGLEKETVALQPAASRASLWNTAGYAHDSQSEPGLTGIQRIHRALRHLTQHCGAIRSRKLPVGLLQAPEKAVP